MRKGKQGEGIFSCGVGGAVLPAGSPLQPRGNGTKFPNFAQLS